MHPGVDLVKSVLMDSTAHGNGGAPMGQPPARSDGGEDGGVTLVLRVRLDAAGRLVGSVLLPDAEPVSFTGWLELMTEVSRNVPIGDPRLS